MKGAGESRPADLPGGSVRERNITCRVGRLLCSCVLFLHFAQRFPVCRALRFALDLFRERWVQPDLN